QVLAETDTHQRTKHVIDLSHYLRRRGRSNSHVTLPPKILENLDGIERQADAVALVYDPAGGASSIADDAFADCEKARILRQFVADFENVAFCATAISRAQHAEWI